MISIWFPQNERSVAFAFMSIGTSTVSLFGNTLTGYLCEHGEQV